MVDDVLQYALASYNETIYHSLRTQLLVSCIHGICVYVFTPQLCVYIIKS